MSNDFASLLSGSFDRNANRGSANIMSENHDMSQISVTGDEAGSVDHMIRNLQRYGDWDASEFGITREQAVAILEAADTDEARELALQSIRDRAVHRANLHTRNGKIALYSAGRPTWHTRGTHVAEAVTSLEAMQLGQLADWNLQLLPLGAMVDGMWQETPGAMGVWKPATETEPGCWLTGNKSVSSSYVIFTNEECFDFMDSIVTGDVRYDCVGALGNGSEVFMSVRLPNETIANGDEVERYALLSTTHDGSGSIKVMNTGHRVVCQNTQRMALSARNDRRLSFRHTKNVASNVDKARAALGLVDAQQREYAEAAREMAKSPVDAEQTRSIFNAAIDSLFSTHSVAGVELRHNNESNVRNAIQSLKSDTEKAAEIGKLEKALKVRQSAFAELLERNDTQTSPGTAWGAYNAVTEYANHSSKVRYRGTETARAESRMHSLVNGKAADAGSVAFQAALATVN